MSNLVQEIDSLYRKSKSAHFPENFDVFTYSLGRLLTLFYVKRETFFSENPCMHSSIFAFQQVPAKRKPLKYSFIKQNETDFFRAKL